ncbi:Retrovirus-related Pol polyprotein from transposon RE2 [Vitis vinifera]|uniref:Retrovirus-related Pol polyprotein from transposon RE2 n=1 Tax=Vitis vinifera TaxID=29760 RepID=A0A438FC33_VITVI|nr:Retrovirus-related Pol polyprotein from transposon RE2 [Vitis vinifera]
MTTKNQIFTSVLSGSPLITSEKLVGSENYLSWSASVELWFMGQGYEDHLVTQEADIPEVDRVQWRKIDAQLCSVLWQSVDPRILLHLQAYKTCFKFWTQAKGLYTNDIQRLYKVASAIVHLSQQDLDLSTYIGQIASLKEQFLTVMPLTPDVGAQQTQLDKFFMVLTLIGLRPDLEPIRDQILDSSVLVSQTTSRGGDGTRGRGQRPHCTYCNKLGHTRDLCYQLHGRPSRTAHMAQSSDSPLPSASELLRISDHLRLLLPLLPSLDLFSSITTTSDLPTVTLANGPEYGEDDCIGRGLKASITSPQIHLLQFAFPLIAPLFIHNRLGHPSLSKFQKMVPRFSTLSSLPCESCQLGKHTCVSFPKRLNNWAKSPFELVHTDVWGPLSTASTLGFQYFVTFIDDYSRLTMPGIFFSPITSFMSSSWDSHQSSCAHTPQQNGVAERKNRHLVETARTLLLHSHIPHSLLFPDQPLYFLPPRVLGCTCFVHILTPGQDKLSAKAMKCLSWDIPDFRRVIVVIPLRLIGTLSPLMSPSLRTHHSFPPLLSLFLFLKSCPFPLSPHLMLCPLDHFRFIIVALVSLLLSLPIPSASPAPALPSPNDLPIAVRKGWRQAMVDEMAALHSNGTWILLFYPLARLVAKGYTQVYGSDYGDTFSLVAKIASVRLLLSMAAMLRRSLYGLKQSPRAWFSRFSSVVQEFGMLRNQRLGETQVFLGIEIAQSSSGVVLSQRKYALDILEETGMLDCKPVDTPMDPNVKLVPGQGEPLGDLGDIDGSHWDAVIRILRYIKSTPGQGVLYENRGHTQVVGYTDADWAGSPTDRRSNFRVALHIASNPVFHERTKHIEVDCHFIREKIASGCVATSFVNSNDQLADIFTKSLRGPRIKYICNKLGAYDVYAPA